MIISSLWEVFSVNLIDLIVVVEWEGSLLQFAVESCSRLGVCSLPSKNLFGQHAPTQSANTIVGIQSENACCVWWP